MENNEFKRPRLLPDNGFTIVSNSMEYSAKIGVFFKKYYKDKKQVNYPNYNGSTSCEYFITKDNYVKTGIRSNFHKYTLEELELLVIKSKQEINNDYELY